MKLKTFNNLVQIRFETLIKNIKNDSNSFYDSYLDLLEGTVKYVLDNHGINYNKNSTCGNIIKEKTVAEFLINELNLDEYTFNKLPDYIKKCNDHKHKKEKMLNIESIINYLRVYFNFINFYYDYIKEENIIYDENYFISIYKETEILNNKYKDEISMLKKDIIDLYEKQKISDDEFEKYKKLLSIKDIEKFNLEEQNNYLETQLKILLDIKNNRIIEEKIVKIEKQNEELLKQLKMLEENKSMQDTARNKQNFFKFLQLSEKYYIWFGEKFSLLKKILLYTGLTNILLSVLIAIITTIYFDFYTTYSFFENIYSLFMIAILIKNCKTKKRINHFDLKNLSTFKYNLNDNLLYCSNDKEKKSYKIFRILAYISSVMSLLLALLDFKPICIIIIILEILYFISLIVNTYYKKEIHYGYGYIVQYIGKQLTGNEIVSIVYIQFENKYYSYDDFAIKYQEYLKND